jgi:hypothetical protein
MVKIKANDPSLFDRLALMRRPTTPARRARLLPLAALLAVITPFSAAGQTPPATTPAPPAATDESASEASVEGFRSARFGMTEAQLRAAIKSDFKLADAAIRASVHPVEQTRVLQVTVRDLVASGGEAQIAYVLGFRSKTLVQINVLWSAADTAGAETVVATANALRDLFVNQAQAGRFKKDSITVNATLPDGRVVVFRGADEQKRTVELILAAAPTGPATPGAARQVGAQLRLMYIQSPDNPDINKLKPGQF